MDTKLGQSTVGEMLPYFVIIALLFIFIVFSISILIKSSKIKKAAKKEMKKKKKNGLLASASGKHMAGLTVPEGLMCAIEVYADKYIFLGNNSKFDLIKSKVTNVCIKTDTEITQQYVSSVGGAVAGAVVFGPLGAIVGGRAKKKKDTKLHAYLIFTYCKNDGVDYISFDITNCSGSSKVISDFFTNVAPAQISYTL
ncbi:hypothetical protein [Robinsoniella peoriensis]